MLGKQGAFFQLRTLARSSNLKPSQEEKFRSRRIHIEKTFPSYQVHKIKYLYLYLYLCLYIGLYLYLIFTFICIYIVYI